MRITNNRTVKSIVASLLLSTVSMIGAFRADAVASEISTVDQPLVVPSTVVFGTDNPLVDVHAVQSAVDQGGTILLRGTFDFGTDAGNHIIVPGRTGAAQDEKGRSTVFIYLKDVVITGETGPQGELLTVVRNGMPAFWIGWDGEVFRSPPPGTYGVDFGIETFPVDVAGRVNYRDTGAESGYAGPQTRYARAYQDVSATIRSISFISPRHYGVKATAGRDVFLVGNAFRDVRYGGLIHLNNFVGANHIAGGFAGIGMLYAPFLYPAITGSIVAKGNIVDGVGTEIINTRGGECLGLGAVATLAAVRIERNEVRNVGRLEDGTGPVVAANSIFIVDNYRVAPRVAQNTVCNSAGRGIQDLVIAAPTPGPMIEHNTMIDCEIGILTFSFVGPMTGRLFHQNSFTQVGLTGGGQYGIVGNQLSDSLIRANRFECDYAGPLAVLSGSTNCTLQENLDLRPTIPQGSPTYFLDSSSSGNLVQGASGTALDLGTGNEIFLRGPGWK